MAEVNEGDHAVVQKYLKNNPKLAEYLNKAYSQGIDWDKLREDFLGNAEKLNYTDYKDSEGNTHMTNRAKSAHQNLVHSLGYDNAADFEQTLENAGYDLYAGTAWGKKDKSDGTQLQIYLVEIPGKGVHYVDQKGRELDMRKKAITPKVKIHQDYLKGQAKKLALRSKASNDWAALGKRLGLAGHFYDRMIARGFTYNPQKGTYSKDNYTYYIQNGQLRRKDKLGTDRYVPVYLLPQLLGLK